MYKLSFILIFCIITGCYTSYQLPSLSPTKKKIDKNITIHTNSGGIVKLISFEITEDKIIGYDKKGDKHELLLSNIQSMHQKKLTKTGKTINIIIISSLIAGLVFLIYYYFSIRGFSDLS